MCNTCLRRGVVRHASNPRSTRPLPSPFSIALRRVFVFVRVWSPAVDSMWSALRDGAVSRVLTYESLRQPPLLALRSICSCTSLYILPQITPRAFFSNERVDVVLTSVTAGACPGSSRLLSPSRPYTMCSSRLPPSPRSLLIVHRRSSIVRYSSSPGKSVPALRRRTSYIAVRVLYHGCPRLPLPGPCALLPASCSMAAVY